MSFNSNLICFKHCCPTSIFCKKVPEKCPICKEFLITFLLEPFLLPYPLVNAKDYPCCIVVRPSDKDFLSNYEVTDDLHIGLTNSDGHVIEYDKCGLVKNDNEKWKCCAAITLIPDSWEIFWDDILAKMCSDPEWNSLTYDPIDFNCFNFVISFLKNLKYKDIQFMNKEEMCKVFILPKIQNILKYALLHKQLKDQDFYIQE